MIILGDFFHLFQKKKYRSRNHLQVAWESGIFWLLEETLNISLCDSIQLQSPVWNMVYGL